MELWTRSKDKKKLILITNAYVVENSIYTRMFEDEYVKIGDYNSEERCIEILDEMQKMLEPQMVLSKVGEPIAETCDGTIYVSPNEYEIKELSCIIYEMPEK